MLWKHIKKLYLLQGFLVFILYLLGANYQKEQARLVAIFYEQGYEAGPYGQPTVYFAVFALLIGCFCIFIGMKTASRLRRLGQLMLVVNIGFTIFAAIMIASPRGISLEESLRAWYGYYVANVGLAYFAHSRIDNAPLPLKDYDSNILDDI